MQEYESKFRSPGPTETLGSALYTSAVPMWRGWGVAEQLNSSKALASVRSPVLKSRVESNQGRRVAPVSGLHTYVCAQMNTYSQKICLLADACFGSLCKFALPIPTSSFCPGGVSQSYSIFNPPSLPTPQAHLLHISSASLDVPSFGCVFTTQLFHEDILFAFLAVP